MGFGGWTPPGHWWPLLVWVQRKSLKMHFCVHKLVHACVHVGNEIVNNNIPVILMLILIILK